MGKFANNELVIPYEANLLILNMMAYVILNEKLYNNEFIDSRCKEFETYKNSILNDPFANPSYMENIEGYEVLATQIPIVAREYATKKINVFFGV